MSRSLKLPFAVQQDQGGWPEPSAHPARAQKDAMRPLLAALLITLVAVGAAGRWHGFALTPGTRRGRNYMSALTRTHAITAWLLSRPYNGHPMRVFREFTPR